MFKAIVLCALCNRSGDQMVCQLRDRLSFMRFIGLGLEDNVPDAKTMWLYREHLARAGVIEGLFGDFDGYLAKQGYLAMGGRIIDASIVPVPIQRNTTRSRVRARVEHVFGAQSNDMAGTLARSIGLARATARIGLKNLAYNMRRLVRLERLVAPT